jgi:hypothetical protein
MTQAIQDSGQRILALIREFMNRVDEQNIERFAAIGVARLRRLVTETTTTGGLRVLEQTLEDLNKRVQRLEQRPPGQAA